MRNVKTVCNRRGLGCVLRQELNLLQERKWVERKSGSECGDGCAR